MNDLTLAGNVFTHPSAAFAELRERPRFWWPLLAIIISAIVIQVWYFKVVDIAWLRDHLFSGNARMDAMSPDQRERAMATISPNTMIVGSIFSIAIVVPAMMALQGAYLLLAGKITAVHATFKQWFSLVAWSGLPALIGALIGAILLATQASPVQLGPGDLQLLSLNEFGLNLKPNEPGYQLAISLNLLSLSSWVLAIVGVRTWSNRSWLFSSIYVLLPFVVVYGCWALLAFR